MKKFIAIILSALCVLTFCACSGTAQLQYGKEYVYQGITFERDPSITFEQISSLVPMHNFHEPVKNFSDYEKFVRDNLDEYKIECYLKPNKVVEIVFSIPFDAITINDTSITIKVGNESHTETLTMEDNEIVLSERQFIRFKNGKLYYSITLIDGYEIHYNYV